jgi:hypothetical protein
MTTWMGSWSRDRGIVVASDERWRASLEFIDRRWHPGSVDLLAERAASGGLVAFKRSRGSDLEGRVNITRHDATSTSFASQPTH